MGVFAIRVELDWVFQGGLAVLCAGSLLSVLVGGLSYPFCVLLLLLLLPLFGFSSAFICEIILLCECGVLKTGHV